MKKTIKILIGLIIVSASLLGILFKHDQQKELTIYFFDVGQGDAILIRTPAHQNILIDGGPDNALITKIGQALPFYDRQIDLMVLTHPHDDHLFGLVEVLRRYRVKQILATGILHTTDAYLEWLRLIKDKQIPFKVALSGQEFVYKNQCRENTNCQFDELFLRVIYPFQNLSGKKSENLNQTSVVIQLKYGNEKFLFAGDLEKAGESEIISRHTEDLESQVIKIGHHGSNTSSGENFIKAVNPLYAVIQVGKDNKFGHPSKNVIEELNNQKIKILRTDLQGSVILSSDGNKIRSGP
jgi:competence protein ComEC